MVRNYVKIKPRVAECSTCGVEFPAGKRGRIARYCPKHKRERQRKYYRTMQRAAGLPCGCTPERLCTQHFQSVTVSASWYRDAEYDRDSNWAA